MAKKKSSTARRAAGTRKTTSPRKRGSVKKVIHQVKEPLSLLQTLREEGMSNALTFISIASDIASGAAKSFRAEAIRPQLGELISSLGFAMREDLERLQDRVGELEERFSQFEYAALQATVDSEE